MQKVYIRFVLQSILLILLQVALFNNVRIFSYLIPILYSYPLLKLPIKLDRWMMILLAAVIGLLVDMFMNTPGLNFAAFTLIGYLRNPILHLSISEESYTELTELDSPSFTTHKVWLYILYLSLCVITHTSVLFLLESFSTKLFVNTLPYILGSTSVTLVTFLIFDSIGASRKKP